MSLSKPTFWKKTLDSWDETATGNQGVARFCFCFAGQNVLLLACAQKKKQCCLPAPKKKRSAACKSYVCVSNIVKISFYKTDFVGIHCSWCRLWWAAFWIKCIVTWKLPWWLPWSLQQTHQWHQRKSRRSSPKFIVGWWTRKQKGWSCMTRLWPK